MPVPDYIRVRVGCPYHSELEEQVQLPALYTQP